MNKEYIKALSPEALFERGKSFIDLERWNQVAVSQRMRLVTLLADGITVLSDFSKGWDWVVERPVISADQFPVEPEQRQRVLAAAIPILQGLSGENHPAGAVVQAKLDELNQSLDFGKGFGKSKGIVLKTLRYALTGEQHGPALAEVVGILGLKKCLERLVV